MKTLVPAAAMTSLRKEMDRLYDRLWQGDGLCATTGEWSPYTDFSENPEGFVVKLEIPGIDPKNVQVIVQSGMLTVKGEKKEEVKELEEHYFRMERPRGTFVRTVKLPSAVDESKVRATFKNGLLTVTLPKTAESRGTAVPIAVA